MCKIISTEMLSKDSFSFGELADGIVLDRDSSRLDYFEVAPDPLVSVASKIVFKSLLTLKSGN